MYQTRASGILLHPTSLPGTTKGNWEWRFTTDMPTPTIREGLRELTRIYERSP